MLKALAPLKFSSGVTANELVPKCPRGYLRRLQVRPFLKPSMFLCPSCPFDASATSLWQSLCGRIVALPGIVKTKVLIQLQYRIHRRALMLLREEKKERYKSLVIR